MPKKRVANLFFAVPVVVQYEYTDTFSARKLSHPPQTKKVFLYSTDCCRDKKYRMEEIVEKSRTTIGGILEENSQLSQFSRGSLVAPIPKCVSHIKNAIKWSENKIKLRG